MVRAAMERPEPRVAPRPGAARHRDQRDRRLRRPGSATSATSCERSGVGAVVDVDALPRSAVLAAQPAAVQRDCARSPAATTTSSSSPRRRRAPPTWPPRRHRPASRSTRIGRIEAGRGLRLVDRDGRPQDGPCDIVRPLPQLTTVAASDPDLHPPLVGPGRRPGWRFVFCAPGARPGARLRQRPVAARARHRGNASGPGSSTPCCRRRSATSPAASRWRRRRWSAGGPARWRRVTSVSPIPRSIVWDEIVAFWLVLWLVTPASWLVQAVAFALFRFFDAAKPGPIAWADQRFKPRPGAADRLGARLRHPVRRRRCRGLHAAPDRALAVLVSDALPEQVQRLAALLRSGRRSAGDGGVVHRRPHRRGVHRDRRLERLVRARLRHLFERRQVGAARRRPGG